MPCATTGGNLDAVAQWRKGAKLGWGHFGVVFTAARVNADGSHGTEDHAIKYLQSDWLAVPEAVERFRREIQILRGLDHPNVMPVISQGTNGRGVPFFVMPRARDGSLKDAIVDGRCADEGWSVSVFREMLRGVAHAHDSGVLHRDLKPSNVLMSGRRPLVSDFGIAKHIDVDGTTLTRTAQELGTLRYMAPEQAADAKRAKRSADVYALGKILIHMLTGSEPVPLVVNLREVPEQFIWFADKCCRDSPDERFQTAAEALEKFDRLLRRPEIELPPVDQGRELSGVATKALGSDVASQSIEALEIHFRGHADQEALFRSVLPRVSKAVLRRWAQQSPVGFRETLRLYDSHISVNGDLPFEYCDVVADFSVFLLGITTDLMIRRRLLARMLEVGSSHNRYYVRTQLVDLLASFTTHSDVALAEEVLDEHRRAAGWCAEAALKEPLSAPIAESLRRARSGAHALR